MNVAHHWDIARLHFVKRLFPSSRHVVINRSYCTHHHFNKHSNSSSSSTMAKKRSIEEATKSSSSFGVSYLPSSQVFMQVIETGIGNFGKSLYVWSDNNRYLFNVPENISRTMRTIPAFQFSRLQDIFVTHRSWANLAGMHGLALSASQASTKLFRIHGPSNIENIFQAQNWMYDGSSPVILETRHFSSEIYEDETMTVRYAPLVGQQRKSTSVKVADKLDANLEDIMDVYVAFICHLKQRPGKMNVQECIRLSIPFGPLFGQLQRGQEITLPDGRVVKPEHVLYPPEPSTSFIVLEVHDGTSLDSLLKSKAFDDYFTINRIMQNQPPITLIVHMTPDVIFWSKKYQEWMDKFGPQTKHMVLNETCMDMPHDGVFRMNAQLNRLNENIFPKLSIHETRGVQKTQDLDSRVVVAEPFLKYHLRPHDRFQRDEFLSANLTVEDCVSQMMAETPELETKLEEYKNRVQESEKLFPADILNPLDSHMDYPQVIFLGTGSAVQTKYRNVSGSLLCLTPHHFVLLDAGEGTFNQIYLLYGPERVWDVLTRIRLAFISHMHADHTSGLVTVLMKRREAFDRLQLNFEPVSVLAPSTMLKTHHLFSYLVEDVMPLAKRLSTTMENKLISAQMAELRSRLNLRSISTMPVIHPKSAHALILTTAQGRKVVYSGDTKPCAELEAAGRDCDLLIHEATLDDTRLADARMKFHSTIGQAMEAAKNMRAKFALLTHFSSRYIIPVLSSDIRDALELQRQQWNEAMISTPQGNDTFDVSSSQLQHFVQVQQEYGRFALASDFMHFRPSLQAQLVALRPLVDAAFRRYKDDATSKAQLYDLRLLKQRERKARELHAEEKMPIRRNRRI